MTSLGYKSFAIWGAGNMGRHIVEELLALKVKRPEISIMVLTRPV
jgi:pyrroline-5-carboxylate reductase